MARPTRRSRGLTLVEVLIGMVVTAIIAAVISSIFFASSKVWRRCSAQSQAEPPATMSIDRISHELRNAYLIDYMGSNKITFTLPVTDASGYNLLPLTGKTRLTYFLSDSTGIEGHAGTILWRKQYTISNGQTRLRRLANNVLSIGFSYDATDSKVLKIYALSITVQGREGPEVYYAQFGTHIAFRN
jgi:prepilin-type N-terminal cleavage/methylation domain-containing protein